MSIEYKLWLRDDFDWGYVNFGGKTTVDKEVQAIAPHAERIASFYGWLIYDIGKSWPHDFYGKVTCDDMLYTGDAGHHDLPIPVMPNAEGHVRPCSEAKGA